MLSPALREFHDSVFVVTAPGFDERHEHVTNELGTGNFEFVYGVNKASTSKQGLIEQGVYDEQRAIELDRSSKPMTLGHICCSIGHANVYRRIIDENIEHALIFEDDVTVFVGSDEDIVDAVKTVPEDAGLIYWGWKGETRSPWHGGLKKWLYRRQHDMGLLKYSHKMIDNLYPREYNEHFLRAGKAFCTHSYTVTRRAAMKLLEWNTPIALNSDNALMHAVLNGDVTAYASRTQFFGQRSQVDVDPVASLTQT